MNDYQLEDLLDQHSMTLRDGRSSGAASGPVTEPVSLGDMALAITPFLLIAQEVAALLLPLAPRVEFRQSLHRSLVQQARRQQAQSLLDLAEPLRTPFVPEGQSLPYRVAGWITEEAASFDMDRRWVFGAAAVGSAVSVAGILAYMLSHRGRPAASA
jgi:hypothetical protein